MSQAPLNSFETTLARLLNRRLRSAISPTGLSPIQITVIYGVFGFLALYFSDVYLPRAVQDPIQLARLQAVKGGVEIIVTAGVIFVLTTWSRRAIETRNDRLETLRAERNLLHRVFRHNLRQDINVIMGYTDQIRDGTNDDVLLPKCQKVRDRLDRIERYQNKIVKIERLLEPSTSLRRLNLSKIIERNRLLRRLQDADDVSVSVVLPEQVEVIAIPQIESAFEEVLENAVEHNDADEPEITVAIEENSNTLIDLVVTDDGPGISEYERVALGNMHEEDLTHSSGLGLWLAKLACTVSGGNLEIPEQPAGGGRVVMQLPEAPKRTIRRRLSAISG